MGGGMGVSIFDCWGLGAGTRQLPPEACVAVAIHGDYLSDEQGQRSMFRTSLWSFIKTGILFVYLFVYNQELNLRALNH